jgi:hypothetical protein
MPGGNQTDLDILLSVSERLLDGHVSVEHMSSTAASLIERRRQLKQGLAELDMIIRACQGVLSGQGSEGNLG